MKSTWILIPVHNRRETTLRCLAHLKDTQEWNKFEVLLIDDGSTDGTSEAVRTEFPAITVLEGDGSLWWGGAMKKGMMYALDQGAEVFIWLNDDVLPEPGSIQKLSEKTTELGDTVLTTKVISEFNPKYTTCFKKTRLGMKSIPYDTDSQIQYCDATAGKFTAFPRKVINTIGLPDADTFPHNLCDYDYTFRAKKRGFNVGVYTDVSARDIGEELKIGRFSPQMTFRQLVENYFNPNNQAHYNVKTRYYRYNRFYGPPKFLSLFALLYYICTVVVVLIGKLILVTVR